jgi:hypothetical protein
MIHRDVLPQNRACAAMKNYLLDNSGCRLEGPWFLWNNAESSRPCVLAPDNWPQHNSDRGRESDFVDRIAQFGQAILVRMPDTGNRKHR